MLVFIILSRSNIKLSFLNIVLSILYVADETDMLDVVNKVFEDISVSQDNLDDDFKYSIWISYLEVYNENIYDLLDVLMDRKPLKMGYDSAKNYYVKGESECLSFVFQFAFYLAFSVGLFTVEIM